MDTPVMAPCSTDGILQHSLGPLRFPEQLGISLVAGSDPTPHASSEQAPRRHSGSGLKASAIRAQGLPRGELNRLPWVFD